MTRARSGLTLARSRGYPRPSFAPVEARTCTRERSCRTRIPASKAPVIAGSRSLTGTGSTTSDSAQATWPSTSSSPATRIGPPGSRRVSTPSRWSIDTGSSPRSPGTFRGLRVSVVSTGIGTDNVEIALAEVLAITERPDLRPRRLVRRPAAGDGARRPGHHDRRRPPRVDDQLLRPRWIPRPSPITRRSLALIEAAETLGHRYHVGLTATAPGLLRCAGTPDPAAAHPLP